MNLRSSNDLIGKFGLDVAQELLCEVKRSKFESKSNVWPQNSFLLLLVSNDSSKAVDRLTLSNR